jgi:type I restriction enzyme S subunit
MPHYGNRQVGEANEVPFEVPEGWVWTNLGEITNYGNCENVDVNDIPSNGWVLELEDLEKDSAKIIQQLTKNERDIKGVRHSFHKGDVLYSKLRTYLNKVMVANKDGFCTTEIIPITCMSYVLPEYLNHVLRSKYFVDYTTQCGYGVKMPRLSTTDACNGQIPLPPYNEQKHIVASIEGWFQLIDILESDKADLDEAIQKAKSKILDLAIHGKLVPQDPNDEPAIELLKRINPSFAPCDNAHDTNQLPDSWCWTTLGDVCELVTGSTPSKLHPEYYGGDFPFYKPTDLDAGRHVNIPSEFLTDEGKNVSRIIPVGSTAICCIGSIGKCGYIEKEGTTNQQINTAVPSKSLSPLYLYYFCNSSYFIDELSADSSAITISIVNKSKLSKMLISLPPYNEQLRIVAKIEELFAVLDEIQKSIK